MSSIVISGDTSGAITLAAPAVAGTNTITLPASTGTVLTTGSPQSGGVIQVQSTTVTAYTALSVSTTKADFAGMSVSITPKFSTSKILVQVNIAFNSPAIQTFSGFVLRDSTIIGQGTGSNSTVGGCFGIATANDPSYRLWETSFSYLDSPATTSAITYKIQIANNVNTQTIYFNGTGSNGSANATGCSTITVMEIAA
jgi:hypothetical protein